MANIFRHTSDGYFQLPKKFITDGLFKVLNGSAKDLYIFLLYRAQESSSRVLLVKTSEILKMTRVKRNAMTEAREQLELHRLVNSTEVSSGQWRYEIVTGVDSNGIDFARLTREELEPFFVSRLGSESRPSDNGLVFRCPFHPCKRAEYPLSVKLVDTDGSGLGVWQCFACGKAGMLVELEKQLNSRRGKEIDVKTAHDRVATYFAERRDARETHQQCKLNQAMAGIV